MLFRSHLNHDALLVLNNFADHSIQVPLPAEWQQGNILITNQSGIQLTDVLTLEPFTTLAIRTIREEKVHG